MLNDAIRLVEERRDPIGGLVSGEPGVGERSANVLAFSVKLMRRHILLLAILLGSILPAIPNARQAAAINLWSLRYAAEVHDFPPSQAALPSPPDGHPRATLWEAITALNSGDGHKALALSQPLVAEGDQIALQIMARAFELVGDFPAATQIWKQNGSEYALFRVAESATEEGRLDDALEAYYAAWELYPAGQSTGRLASFLWKEKKDPVAAEAVMRQSIAAYPRFEYRHDWLHMLAAILEAQGHWSEAAEVYQQIIEVYQQIIVENPGRWQAYYKGAWAYRQSDQPDQAIAMIEQAWGLQPSDCWVIQRAGQIYEFAGKMEKALAAYRQVLALCPDDKTAREGLERLTGHQ